MKELLKILEEAERKANIADTKYEANPEDEELEKAFDEAYKAEFEAFEALANEIVKITGGQIEKATASTMIRAKRNELKALIEKIA